jgi:hypothetical protein
MADAVTTEILQNGDRYAIVKFTNYSDGTGESAVTKIDATSGGSYGVVIGGRTFYPGVNLKVRRVWYDVKNMGLQVLWHATSDVDAFVLGGFGTFDFRDFGGVSVPTGVTGITGSIDFTAVPISGVGTGGVSAGYTVVLEISKGIPQS